MDLKRALRLHALDAHLSRATHGRDFRVGAAWSALRSQPSIYTFRASPSFYLNMKEEVAHLLHGVF